MKRNGYAVGLLALLTLVTAMPTDAAVTPSVSEAKAGEHDLMGMWRIDAARSDVPPVDVVEALRTETEGGGLGGGVWFLPQVFRIGTSDNGLALSDSTGTILQVVMFMEVADGDGERMPPRFAGTWKDDRLTVYRPGRTGTSLRQSFRLEKDGSRLVVKTRMQRKGERDFEVKRVYLRDPAAS